jgi:hypothetical protein
MYCVWFLFECGTLVYRANVVNSDLRLLRDSTPLFACSIDTNPGTMPESSGEARVRHVDSKYLPETEASNGVLEAEF